MERSNQSQKGVAMNTHIQSDTWISCAVTVLCVILAVSVAGVLILRIADRPVPEILIALGFVATGGLIRLLISPLNQELSE
jgi:hypothetical protein